MIWDGLFVIGSGMMELVCTAYGPSIPKKKVEEKARNEHI